MDYSIHNRQSSEKPVRTTVGVSEVDVLEIDIYRDYAGTYYNRGNTRFELGDRQVAVEDYNKALILDPCFAEAYVNRGNVRSELGDNWEAIEDYNKALSLNRQDKVAYYNRASTYLKLDRKQEASKDLKNTILILIDSHASS
ncbi:MAG: tetratricopeptide repeat protein [Cyanobacteria bacterium J06636_16]